MMKLRREHGFSLVELMIVVAIIAILAAIAIPSFMKFAQKSKTSEATGNLGAIRTCLQSYRAEEDTYILCTINPAAARTGAGAATPIAWDATITQGWLPIGFEPDGMIRYSYAVVTSAVAAAAADIRTDFMVTASTDIDEDGTAALYSLDSEHANYPRPALTPTGEL